MCAAMPHGFENTTPPARPRPIHLPLHRGFLEAHGRSYGYAYCVSPVSKLPTKPQNCRFPILRCRFCSALPLAPLRKGSWRRSRLRGRFRQNLHDGRPMVAPTGIVGTKINNVGAGIARPFFAVSSVVSIPGSRKKCIGRGAKAPIKECRRS